MQKLEAVSVSAQLSEVIRAALARQGGWLPFDRFMALALYAPGLGYYANASRKFGLLPGSGSDFVTAPELSPLFGRALARQVAQALQACGSAELWEFGAGSGALAAQLLEALGDTVQRYTIVELSASLRERQQQRLQAFGAKLHWVDALPETMHGVIVGNEVLDAMPVQLLHFDGGQWFERGVALADASVDPATNVGAREAPQRGAGGAPARAAGHDAAALFAWRDRPTPLRPPIDAPIDAHFVPGSVTEIHPQAEAFMATLAERLVRGAAFFIDYGFPAAEYYHPQRTGGTLMCHRAHRADTDPLLDVGAKDITAHVDFSAIALAAQDGGLDVLGYTSQAHFLINCGLVEMLEGADIQTTANAHKLLAEHEMGELFKVIGFAKSCDATFVEAPLGFVHCDRSHTL
ncbi:MAG: SAM-dependent methyltransferase [Burkholderiaceae bacterium]